MTALIEATELTYRTASGRILASGLSFRLDPHELLLISGPNGSGKSTLLKVLLCQFPLRQGVVRCTVPQERMALIPQMQNMEFHLPMTLWDMLEISVPDPLDITSVLEIGLLTEKQLSVSWNTASGGERQRAMLTRALLQRPSLLLLDEPLNHLDEESGQHLLAALSRFLHDRKAEPRGVVLVSHAGIPTALGFQMVRIDLTNGSKIKELT